MCSFGKDCDGRTCHLHVRSIFQMTGNVMLVGTLDDGFCYCSSGESRQIPGSDVNIKCDLDGADCM